MEEKLSLLSTLTLLVFPLATLPFFLIFPKILTEIRFSSYLACYHREQWEGATASQERLLEDRYLLADAGIACQCIGILLDGKLRGCCVGDLQHCTPLAKVSTVFLVLGTALSQSIQPCTWKNSASLRAVLQHIALKSTMTSAKAATQVSHSMAFAAPVIA